MAKQQKKKKPRHYCYNCGARRYENEMHIFKKAVFGKFSWVCNTCGDSRFADVSERGPDSMGFTMQKIQERNQKR